jgi:hypothetical protein
MNASPRRLLLGAALLACAFPTTAPLAAQVLLEEPPRLVLDSLLPRSKAIGGDIRVGDAIYRYHAEPGAKGGGSMNARLWPEGRVGYRWSPQAPLSAQDRGRVQDAMRAWERMTDGAVSFVEVSGPQAEPYLEIMSADDNSSYIGRVAPGQQIHYEPGATWGTYLHELGHALGLEHEQNRSDRDEYVQVLTANVVEGMTHNFGLRQTINCTDYDFQSVMHYGQRFFSRNGEPTLLPHPEFASMGPVMGRQTDLTPGDAAEVKALYTGVCKKPGGAGPAVTGGGDSSGGDTSGTRFLRTTGPTRWVLQGGSVPSADVRKGWNEGLEIVTSARTPTEQYVVMSTWYSGIRQSFQDADAFPTDYVRGKWDEGYRIQHAVHGAGGWQVLMADGLGWGAQSWRKRAYWPKEEIRELWDEGKHITTISYGEGEWFVALTEGSGITTQGWDTTADDFPKEIADRRFADGFRVTGLAWGDGTWAVISSKGTDIAFQSMFWSETFPEDRIREKWAEGLTITSLARSDRYWVVVMSRR